MTSDWDAQPPFVPTRKRAKKNMVHLAGRNSHGVWSRVCDGLVFHFDRPSVSKTPANCLLCIAGVNVVPDEVELSWGKPTGKLSK